MPAFTYNAVDTQGKSTRGVLTADNRLAALDELAQKGLLPLTVEDSGAAAGNGTPGTFALRLPGRTVSAAQVEAFTRELANLLSAGVPLGKALHILRREASHPAARVQWSAIHDDVVGGMPLADALARWQRSFPPVYVAMIRAGEMGGFLNLVLAQIADFRCREGELKGRIVAALIYPCVLAGLAAAVLTFLMIFFIPRFAGIFSDFGAALPLLTRAIVAASTLATRYGLLVALALILAVIALRRAMTTEAGRRRVERLCLRAPGLGIILARFALVRFASMLGTLVRAGVPLVKALRVAQEAIGNQTLADAVSSAIDQVKRGSALSRALGACPQLFPPSVVEMIAVAEETGRLDQELLRLSQAYESELDRRLRMLVALAEPALLFVMAGLIGTIVVGMLLPIFTLQELIK